MELTVKKDTIRLIEAFQGRHSDPLWEAGRSKTAALKGALMEINAYLSDEKSGETMLEGGANGTYKSFTMKGLFEKAAERQKTDTSENINLVNLPNDLEVGGVLRFVTANNILPQNATAGQAVDLAMKVAHDLTDKGPISTKTKDGFVRGRLVFI